jgi:hypothetical protein
MMSMRATAKIFVGIGIVVIGIFSMAFGAVNLDEGISKVMDNLE